MTDNAGNVKRAAQAASDLVGGLDVLAFDLYRVLGEINDIQSNVGHRVGLEPGDLVRIRGQLQKVAGLYHTMDKAIDNLWS